MRWFRIWECILLVAALAYLFVPAVFEFFPMGFPLVAVGIVITGPFSGLRAYRQIQRRDDAPPTGEATHESDP